MTGDMNVDTPLSPELALVDPVLAERARAGLEPPGARARTPVADPRPLLVLEPASLGRGSSPRLLVGVAAAVALSLLLFDVRVEVGEHRAGANPTTPATTTEATTPASPAGIPEPPRPSAPASSPSERRFAWAPAPGASGYHVELVRDGSRVFAADTTDPELVLPRAWEYRGGRHVLERGDYRWYVWPVVDGIRARRAVVQASLSVP